MRWRKTIEKKLLNIWYNQAPIPLSLKLLEYIYHAVWQLRKVLYRLHIKGSKQLPVPVIVIGNITVGGTGKTPLVTWLTQELLQRGWRPGIITRGYGGLITKPHRIMAADTAHQVGDEALLISRITQVPVAVGANRWQTGLHLLNQTNCNVILSDDGLQHWALARDIEIAVIDGQRNFGNHHLIPAGPLREHPTRLDSVDYVVTNGTPQLHGINMHTQIQHAISMTSPEEIISLSTLAGSTIHAVAGIGNAQRFFDMLTAYHILVISHPLPDHHHYSGHEFDFPDSHIILITEKDAVKCLHVKQARVYYVPLITQLPIEFADQVHQRLIALST